MNFDLIVVGSGPSGYVAALRAAQLGLKVACVEKEGTLGGTCLNVGCIPSKSLLESSERYEWLQKSASDHGIVIGQLDFDFKAMMKRKEKIVGGLIEGIVGLFKQAGIEHLRGKATFVSPNTLKITSNDEKKTISSAHIIIATGSEPIQLPFLPFDEKIVVSSTGALSLSEIPKRLVVIGGGVIGLELASVYRRLGSAVTVVEMLDRIAPTMDQALSKQLLQSLKKQGMEFLLGAKVKSGKKIGNGMTIAVEQEGKAISIDADVVLVAVGRRPYTQGLGLESVGVALAPNGLIVVNGNFQTSLSHIYAIGDVIDGPMLAHKASHEGVAVAEIISGISAKVNYASIPSVIYTHPEVASVGFSEQEAIALGLEVAVGTSFFRGNGRARCSGETEGFVKVVAEKKTRKLLGLHIIGSHASELIQEGVLAIDKQATLDDIIHSCHAHPTLSETVMEACQQAK